VPNVTAANLLQSAKYFDITLITCATLGNILIFVALAVGAIVLQAGFALIYRYFGADITELFLTPIARRINHRGVR